jgi:hypothetical protein
MDVGAAMNIGAMMARINQRGSLYLLRYDCKD